jgi:hypothetical protein
VQLHFDPARQSGQRHHGAADLQAVFAAILTNAVRICEANFGNLFRFVGKGFYEAAQVNTPIEWMEALRRRVPLQPTPGTF